MPIYSEFRLGAGQKVLGGGERGGGPEQRGGGSSVFEPLIGVVYQFLGLW